MNLVLYIRDFCFYFIYICTIIFSKGFTLSKFSKINLLVASLFSAAVYAADLTTNKIEVISTTPLGGIGLTPDKIPADIKVVKGKKMQEQGSLTVADYMNTNMAGVSVTETQGNPYQPDVRYHGFNANSLLGSPQGLSVYQDGVRVNEPFGDVVSWDLIPMNAIREFQLIPGANPIYGRNTLGGSISLKTKRGRDVQGGAIELSGGSWNRKNTNFEYGNLDAKSGIDYFVSGNYFDEDGWRKASGTTVRQLFAQVGKQNDTTDVNFTVSMADNEMIGNGLTPHDLMDTTGRNAIYTKPDQTKNKNILMNLSGSHWLNNSTMLSANTYFRRTVTNTLNGDVNDDVEEFEYSTVKAAAWDNACNGGSIGTWVNNGKSNGGSWINGNNRELFCSGRINYTDTRKTSTGFTLQASSNQKFFDKEHQIITGLAFDFSQVKFSQYGQYGLLNADRGVNPIDFFTEAGDESPKLKGRTYDWGLYGSDTISLNEKLNLTLAGRYNNTNINNKDPNDPIHIDEGHPERSLAGNHSFQRFNPSVGLTYNPSNDLKIYTSYSESNRAPTSMELGCANPAVPCKLPNAMAGDPPLKQVVNRSVDLGAKGALTKDINWSVGTYVSLNSDDIQFLTAPAASASQGGYFSNVGDTLRKGIDIGLNGRVSKLRWSANYSFVKATYEDSFTIANDHNTEKWTTDCSGNSLGTSTASGVGSNSDGTGTVTRTNYGICVNPGKEIPGIPNHQLKLRTDFQATPNWNIGATAMIFSDQWLHGVENNVFNPRPANQNSTGLNTSSYRGNGRAGGYGVLNIDTRYRFDDSGWVAFARVNNVFDATYNTGGVQGASFYNAAGTTFLGDDTRRSLFAPGAPRAAWIGIRYEFGGAKKSNDD